MRTEETPNPLARKFYADTFFIKGEPCFFSDAEKKYEHAFLDDILSLPGVQSLLLTEDFMTITKTQEVPWTLLESIIFSAILHHKKSFPLVAEELHRIKEEDDCASHVQEHETSASSMPDDDFQESLSPQERQRLKNWVAPSDDIQAIVEEIEEILETHIRPGVQADGGLITLCAFENGVVYVELQGACSGCPHSQVTLQEGIQRTLRYYIPEVESVEAL